jgi:hypothetical protein
MKILLYSYNKENRTLTENNQWRGKALIMCTRWGLGFCSKIYRYRAGQSHGRNLECLINRQQENLFKTTLISSNHVNNAVGVFTCHKPYPTDQIKPNNLCETLVLVSNNLYPNIYCILTATAERSFSLGCFHMSQAKSICLCFY